MWAWLILLIAGAIYVVRWRRSGLTLIDFAGLSALHCYARLWHGWSSNGLAPIPARGPAILVANHTSSADPALVFNGCPRLVSFLMAAEYFQIAWARPLLNYLRCVPVARAGYEVGAVRLALQLLSDGRILGIFPEGNLSNAGRPRPRPGKAGCAYLALRSRAPVYPVRIEGGAQTSEVLPAWFLPTRQRVRITYGPALDLSAYYDRPITRKLLEEVRALIMRRIEELRGRGIPATRTARVSE